MVPLQQKVDDIIAIVLASHQDSDVSYSGLHGGKILPVPTDSHTQVIHFGPSLSIKYIIFCLIYEKWFAF